MKNAGRRLACLAVLVLLASGAAVAHPRAGVTVAVPIGDATVVVSTPLGGPTCSPPRCPPPTCYPTYSYPTYSYPADSYSTYSYPVYSYPVYSRPWFRGHHRDRGLHRGWGHR